ncbi:shikimate kinase [Candidatus Woesearchaeota archaeon]|nr:shikimate kinase [Candidatus Woesearchaeota archaeon]
MHIILIGYRCTGKTTVGKRLAKLLGRECMDTDELLETQEGKKIDEIVATKGWSYFREQEKKVIHAVTQLENRVISTGGGSILDPENVKKLQERGLLIWLRADALAIKKRMAQHLRPSLTGKGAVEEVEQLIKEREPYYLKNADIIIDANQSLATVFQKIKKVIA